MPADHRHDDIVHPSPIPFALVHLGCLAAIWTGVSWRAAALAVALYGLRMFAVTAGYHRYFSHRAYETGRVFQFVLAVLAQSSAQQSVLWWAGKHRQHHMHSDTDLDVHSPARKGFLYAHMGWMFAPQPRTTDLTRVADLARYPELRLLHRLQLVPAVALAGVCFLIAGWPGVTVGFLWSTVAVYHATFCINSLAHVHGKRRYVTGDDSRNNWLLAVLTLGEGWHNNHHACQASARQGFRWWEFDPTYYLLRLLAALGVVRNLKLPPVSVLRNEQRPGDRVMRRTAEQLAACFDPERIADAIRAAPPTPDLARLQHAAVHAREQVAGLLGSLPLPHLPSRADVAAKAKALFARTRAFDEIVDQARALVLAAVGEQLAPRPVRADA
jgi:stearoyl-CoA desaturase (delta-9 desaturase)